MAGQRLQESLICHPVPASASSGNTEFPKVTRDGSSGGNAQGSSRPGFDTGEPAGSAGRCLEHSTTGHQGSRTSWEKRLPQSPLKDVLQGVRALSCQQPPVPLVHLTCFGGDQEKLNKLSQGLGPGEGPHLAASISFLY